MQASGVFEDDRAYVLADQKIRTIEVGNPLSKYPYFLHTFVLFGEYNRPDFASPAEERLFIEDFKKTFPKEIVDRWLWKLEENLEAMEEYLESVARHLYEERQKRLPVEPFRTGFVPLNCATGSTISRTSPYGLRDSPAVKRAGGNDNHKALDFICARWNGASWDPVGIPNVVFPEYAKLRYKGDNSELGYYADLGLSDGGRFKIGHMQSLTTLKTGQSYEKNTVIARMGGSGSSTGLHAHGEWREGDVYPIWYDVDTNLDKTEAWLSRLPKNIKISYPEGIDRKDFERYAWAAVKPYEELISGDALLAGIRFLDLDLSGHDWKGKVDQLCEDIVAGLKSGLRVDDLSDQKINEAMIIAVLEGRIFSENKQEKTIIQILQSGMANETLFAYESEDETGNPVFHPFDTNSSGQITSGEYQSGTIAVLNAIKI